MTRMSREARPRESLSELQCGNLTPLFDRNDPLPARLSAEKTTKNTKLTKIF